MSTEANNSAYPTDPTMLEKGLTKREYIAAIALSATTSTGTAQERAQEAVALADALNQCFAIVRVYNKEG